MSGRKSAKSSKDGEVYDEEFIVERLVAKRIRNGRTEYQVKWELYADAENTWEPIEHLADGCHHLLLEFEAKHSDEVVETVADEEDSDSSDTTDEDSSDSTGSDFTGDESVGAGDDHQSIDETINISTIDLNHESSDGVTDEAPEEVEYVSREEWPAGRLPARVSGMSVDHNYDIWHFIEWQNSAEKTVLPSTLSNIECPQLVIKYYESICFFDDEDTPDNHHNE